MEPFHPEHTSVVKKQTVLNLYWVDKIVGADLRGEDVREEVSGDRVSNSLAADTMNGVEHDHIYAGQTLGCAAYGDDFMSAWRKIK